MDRSGWIDAKTHRRDGACSASVSSDSSASEVLVLISIAQTSPSQLQAQNSSNNIICWRGDLRPKSPLFPSATLHCSSLSLFVSLPVVSNPGKYLRNQLGCKINWMTIQERPRAPHYLWPLVPGSPRRSRLVTPSDDLRAHHPAGCYSWVASRPDSAGSAGWSRREALALAGAGSQPPWELDLRRSLRLRQTSSPPRFQAERPGDHDGGEHYAVRCRGPRSA